MKSREKKACFIPAKVLIRWLVATNVGKKVSGKKVSGKKVSEKKNPEKKYWKKRIRKKSIRKKNKSQFNVQRIDKRLCNVILINL